ncbi:uncharacterized protein [Palaemon carinicauda]|uniref:uncharacterized protein n=1 Tax=Palaemon carinicauda TaxID=392227 RepID=UPI0035B5D861
MEAVASTSSDIAQEIEIPVSCGDCFLSYGEFVLAYSGNIEKLVDLCQRHNLILQNKNCPHCHEVCRVDYKKHSFRCDKSYITKGRRRKRCSYKVSLFVGTWFSKGKLDIETNLKFIVVWVQSWFCYKVAVSELKLNKGSVCDWSSFSRGVVINWAFRRSKKIGGNNCTVEIDESKFGKRKYNVGQVIDGQWVYGGISRESREFFLVPVETQDRDTLLSLIKERIEPGTTIISDCWQAYNCLAEEGFKHLTVNHSLHFVDPQTQAHTNTVERKWRDVKNLVPKYGRRKKHFVGYLATSYFKLHVSEPSQRLHAFLKAAAHLYQPTD